MSEALRLQFLEWLAAKPRTYGDVMAAWRTSCPRLMIWEDALGDDLVTFDDRTGTTFVVLTAKGRTLVD